MRPEPSTDDDRSAADDRSSAIITTPDADDIEVELVDTTEVLRERAARIRERADTELDASHPVLAALRAEAHRRAEALERQADGR